VPPLPRRLKRYGLDSHTLSRSVSADVADRERAMGPHPDRLDHRRHEHAGRVRVGERREPASVQVDRREHAHGLYVRSGMRVLLDVWPYCSVRPAAPLCPTGMN
jgi:hypothetical protein